MFCSAPAAASREVALISHWRSTRLYTDTTWGCHSHSMPLGTRATSVKVEMSWDSLCGGDEAMRLEGGRYGNTGVGARTFLDFLLWGLKQPMASPFPESRPLVGPSRRMRADGGISL